MLDRKEVIQALGGTATSHVKRALGERRSQGPLETIRLACRQKGGEPEQR